jgi:hypothetical protein
MFDDTGGYGDFKKNGMVILVIVGDHGIAIFIIDVNSMAFHLIFSISLLV